MMNLTFLNSIENSALTDFIDKFDRSFSVSTTNQSISIDNDSENENETGNETDKTNESNNSYVYY